ncbi:hypothetical protein DICPUDRAFT_77205 [Dictyostelium purpureum]|uniref:Uncharacterized protein n=1 Tax=Dictyostelium purpureum TaxID=5786 RepID=F0ZFX4_DICPU|nr:uncharacterized protein DICPUDRAFT_77205 [Dictyostelium purpureum]EGC37190.1 hypothetical protein DICPUDRAFT_77205 [Dictyostelium purpureum]|eukprot:XP_003286318.1 hypothetical protein DICPUDRAFT_77205 [Dictyostelium purpureum]
MVPIMQDDAFTFEQHIFNSSTSPSVSLEDNITNSLSSPQKYISNSMNNLSHSNGNSNGNSSHDHINPFYDDDFSNQFSSSPLKSFPSPSPLKRIDGSPIKFNYQDFNHHSSGLAESPLTPNRSFSDSWIQSSSTLSLSQSPSSDLFLTNHLVFDQNSNNNNNNTVLNNNNNSYIDNNKIKVDIFSQSLESKLTAPKNNTNNENNNDNNNLISTPKRKINIPNLNSIKCKHCDTKMKPKYISFDEVLFMCGTNGCLFPMDDEKLSDFFFPSYLFKKKQRTVSSQ